MNYWRLVYVLAMIALLMSSVSAEWTHAAAPASAFTKNACPFRVPGDLKIVCGTLNVPEDRGQANGPRVHLAVAIVRARTAKPAPDPVLYLSGGPGSAALLSTTLFAHAWLPFLANRDFVVVDQRGTGFSTPALMCPENERQSAALLGEHVTREAKVQAEASAALSCRNRLAAAGVNLAAYTSADSAADLEDLRVALGYVRWNVFGISYGTRLALTLMRDHPAGVRSVVLDSTYPLQANLYTEMPANANRVFKALFDGCAADVTCNAAHPALEATFYDLVARLDAKPASLRVRNPRSGSLVTVVVDGSELIAQLYRMFYISAQIPALPKMITDASKGNYDLLANTESVRLGREGHFSHGMYFSVQCSEEMPFATQAELDSTAAAYPRLQTYFRGILENTATSFSLCTAWGVRQPNPVENQPVRSAIPTLLLAGAYDPITPPAWAKLAASTLSTSYVYTFPNSGHAVIATGACPAGIIAGFLRTPTSAPNAACIAGLRGPRFQ